MAITTKKSTTKSKTKTAKAKASSTKATVRKTAAKKPTPKRVTKPNAARTTSSKPSIKTTLVSRLRSVKRANDITLRTLRGLHFIAIGLSILLALAAGYLMNNSSYQLTMGHLAKDELTSSNKTVLAPAVRGVYDVELRWLVVATLMLSTVLAVFYVTRLKNRYAEYLTKTRLQPLRWIDFAVTGALMIQVTALLSGVSDIATLKLLGGLLVATAVLALISERENNTASKPVRSAYLAGIFTLALTLVFIGSYAVATIVYGTSDVSWYIYALYAVLVLSFVAIMQNQRRLLAGASALVTERNYLVISLLTKVAFAVVLIIGFYR